MAGLEPTKPKPAPLWALALGVGICAAGAFVLLRLLPDQVQAFALHAQGALSRLLIPLAFGELLVVVAVALGLRVVFHRFWLKHPGQFQGWVLVLLAVSSMTATGAMVVSVRQARSEAERVAAAIDQVEKTAIAQSVAGFEESQDADLAVSVFDEMTRWAEPIRALRGVSISRDPRGHWEAVCGQVSLKEGVWTPFVTRRVGAGPLRAALEQDGFDEARRKTCYPLVEKYVGVEGVDVTAYIAQSKALGCTGLDIYYWEAEKTYCHGLVVRPGR